MRKFINFLEKLLHNLTNRDKSIMHTSYGKLHYEKQPYAHDTNWERNARITTRKRPYANPVHKI